MINNTLTNNYNSVIDLNPKSLSAIRQKSCQIARTVASSLRRRSLISSFMPISHMGSSRSLNFAGISNSQISLSQVNKLKGLLTIGLSLFAPTSPPFGFPSTHRNNNGRLEVVETQQQNKLQLTVLMLIERVTDLLSRT